MLAVLVFFTALWNSPVFFFLRVEDAGPDLGPSFSAFSFWRRVSSVLFGLPCPPARSARFQYTETGAAPEGIPRYGEKALLTEDATEMAFRRIPW